MAQRNAQEETERATTVEERTAYTLELLGKMLNLPEPPKRMESFDISNTGKSDIVASMVVYSGTRPLKSAYRRFRIQSLRDIRMTTPPCRRCCADGSSGQRMGTKVSAPAGRVSDRRRRDPRPGSADGGLGIRCGCAHLRHGEG
ncbi:MAG: hypothetical protein ACLTYN_04950 [Dysosmobacter welbionis]